MTFGPRGFLAGEPDYDRPEWIDAYAMMIGTLKPELPPDAAARAAVEAYAQQGWSNPKVAAGLDALFGPVSCP